MTFKTPSLLEDKPVLIKRIREVDFRTLKIGTDEWRRFWRDHPEQQDQMLKFREETKNG